LAAARYSGMMEGADRRARARLDRGELAFDALVEV
jgi:hypothetical protein